ncbi:hypothetical protein GQ600_8823 [Phytophthora cactorum]|nr:hypothetical protein GQ600_8823 [Phytophthora cactorum]
MVTVLAALVDPQPSRPRQPDQEAKAVLKKIVAPDNPEVSLPTRHINLVLKCSIASVKTPYENVPHSYCALR